MTVPAELAARITMARTIAGDYAREARGESLTRPDWYSWAARLHTALVGLMAALPETLISASTRAASGASPTGSATLSPDDVPIVLSALAIAARWDDLAAGAAEDHLAGPGQAVAYRALAYRLGEDR